MAEAPPAIPLGGIHHNAFRCRDAAQTRWFYEEVLGLKAAAGLVIDTVPGTGAETPYMHIFFELGDGNYIAFFDSPYDADADWFDAKNSFDMHVAIEAKTRGDMLAMQDRIKALGVKCFGPIDHDFVESVYMYDPNGIQIEITCRTADHERIMADEAAHLDDVMAAWSERTRQLKEQKFGADSLANRGSRWPAMGH